MLKKTPSEVPEVEKMPWKVSMTEQMKDRISEPEDKVEEMELSSKDNDKILSYTVYPKWEF